MRTLPRPRALLMGRRTGLLPATALVAAATLLAGCGNDGSSTATDPTGGQPAPSSSAPSGSPSGTPSPGSSPSSGTSGSALPVYFVGDTPRGSRLFREFQTGDGTDPLMAAATLLVSGRALDPDYATALPSDLDITGVRVADGAIVVTVGPDSPVSADKSMDPGSAALAVQQLVYTLDAVTQTHDPVKVVQSDGSSEVPVKLYGQATDVGVAAADPLDVLALVNVTEPEQGSTVSGTLHASGVASSFEGNVPWAVHSGGADGPIVKQGAATAQGYIDKLYPWSADVDLSGLPAGDYTFVASTDDPSGGEGPGPTTDSKAFTLG